MIFTTNLFKKYIFSLSNQLTPEFCKNVIDKFEHDPDVTAGKTASGHSVDVKQSTDLMISALDRWNFEDRAFNEALGCGLQKYTNHVNRNSVYQQNMQQGFDIGYQIQRTTPGGFYEWHHDGSDSRYLTFIFYLNDIKNNGYTEFCDGTRIQPEAGKMLIFPATHQYVHRGVAPKNEIKYLMTGWIYSPLSSDERILSSAESYQALKSELQQIKYDDSHKDEHMGGHTPEEGDPALSYGNEFTLQ